MLYETSARLQEYDILYNHVPSIFATGLIVPVLKKPTLDPGIPANYRPLTKSSTLAKFLELLILPKDVVLCNNQFGFRNDFSVSYGKCLLWCLNDLICYSKYHNSNIFIASLDAEKCFDGTMECLINCYLHYLMHIGTVAEKYTHLLTFQISCSPGNMTWTFHLLTWKFHLITWEFNMLTWEFHPLTSKLYLLSRNM